MVVGEAMPGPPGNSGLGREQPPAGRLWADPKDSGLSYPALREAPSDQLAVGRGSPYSRENTHCGRGQPHSRKLNRDFWSSHQAFNIDLGYAGNIMVRLWTWVGPEPTF